MIVLRDGPRDAFGLRRQAECALVRMNEAIRRRKGVVLGANGDAFEHAFLEGGQLAFLVDEERCNEVAVDNLEIHRVGSTPVGLANFLVQLFIQGGRVVELTLTLSGGLQLVVELIT